MVSNSLSFGFPVRDLHNQSKKALTKNFENDFRYSHFEDLRNNAIGKKRDFIFKLGKNL